MRMAHHSEAPDPLNESRGHTPARATSPEQRAAVRLQRTDPPDMPPSPHRCDGAGAFVFSQSPLISQCTAGILPALAPIPWISTIDSRAGIHVGHRRERGMRQELREAMRVSLPLRARLSEPSYCAGGRQGNVAPGRSSAAAAQSRRPPRRSPHDRPIRAAPRPARYSR
jgi:hypothetical protein